MPTRQMFDNQAELRWSMERLADEALTRAGIELDPRGFLVGIPEEDPDLPVRIEPRRRAFDLEQLDGVLDDIGSRLRRRLAQLERQDIPDELEEQEYFRDAVLEGCRREAVGEALRAASRADDRTAVVGLSVVVGAYRIFPVLAVLTEAWEEQPRLKVDSVDGLSVPISFPEAVVHDVLRAASRELDRLTPASLMAVDAGAILRSAADTFVNGVVARTGVTAAHGLRDALDALSAQTYEGRASLGTLVLAARGHASVEVDVTFTEEIPVVVPRSFRKALEMSGPQLRLLCDGRQVYGMGQVASSYRGGPEQVYVVQVVGNGSWELWHAGQPLLRVDHGQPSLPQDEIDDDAFVEIFGRVFPDEPVAARTAVWEMAQACTQQRHGTMLVVHPDAAAEGQRLLPQAQLVQAARLSPRALTAMTKIDGAVLVSPDGTCHAAGVILDGAATGTGDGSRGARYNSAIRYLAGSGKGSMVIIVSEDGRIDLLPMPKRRVSRERVARAVDRLVAAAEEEEDYETFARLDRTVGRLEFYLSAEQCALVNEAREAVEQRRWTEERIRMQVTPVQPHPGLDDSYFIDV